MDCQYTFELEKAIIYNDLEKVKKIVNDYKKSNIEYLLDIDTKYFELACYYNCTNIIYYLIDNFDNIDFFSNNSRALEFILKNGNYELLEYIKNKL